LAPVGTTDIAAAGAYADDGNVDGGGFDVGFDEGSELVLRVAEVAILMEHDAGVPTDDGINAVVLAHHEAV
jgi:hypothetical protein